MSNTIVCLLGTIGSGKTKLAKKITKDRTLVALNSYASCTQKLFKREVYAGTVEREDFFALDGCGT